MKIPVSPVKMTEKHQLWKTSVDLLGLTFSFGATQNRRIANDADPRDHEELTFNHNTDSQGLETTLWRKEINDKIAIRVGGPGINLKPESGELSSRIVGFGGSYELVAPDKVNRVQISGDVRVTHKSVAAAAAWWAPAAIVGAQAMFAEHGPTATNALQMGLAVALPVVSSVLAVRGVRHAIDEVQRDDATKSEKNLAVTRAVGDVVRVFALGIGTLISTVATLASVAYASLKARKWLRAAAGDNESK